MVRAGFAFGVYTKFSQCTIEIESGKRSQLDSRITKIWFINGVDNVN